MVKRCEACSTFRNLTRHHILPRWLGGTLADGAATVCRYCHDLIHWKGELDEITDPRYLGITTDRAARFVIDGYREFILQAGEWAKEGVLEQQLGIDMHTPRNSRRKNRYLDGVVPRLP